MSIKPIVKNYMATHLIYLKADMDVYLAIGLLLRNNISGAPVVDRNNDICGILSEKDCLRVFANGFEVAVCVSVSFIAFICVWLSI